ncbi:hypothetical protein [Acetobacter estunensis]|uniref:hypothetical protein n=1 Tax=Acetobacter estunensis TaxID=104097 RepID=UPI001C2D6435|nr:hypothetical protein [Acetobacter estunensis]MBV1835634.1 hypothetical protein [Acetobacter estunensis]MBV1836105.1 hypothetical protein [Acetobacter estunensis]
MKEQLLALVLVAGMSAGIAFRYRLELTQLWIRRETRVIRRRLRRLRRLERFVSGRIPPA